MEHAQTVCTRPFLLLILKGPGDEAMASVSPGGVTSPSWVWPSCTSGVYPSPVSGVWPLWASSVGGEYLLASSWVWL